MGRCKPLLVMLPVAVSASVCPRVSRHATHSGFGRDLGSNAKRAGHTLPAGQAHQLRSSAGSHFVSKRARPDGSYGDKKSALYMMTPFNGHHSGPWTSVGQWTSFRLRTSFIACTSFGLPRPVLNWTSLRSVRPRLRHMNGSGRISDILACITTQDGPMSTEKQEIG